MIFLCIVWSYHEFHENIVIIATYAHILSKEKYRVIIVSKPNVSCNIVWTQKKDIVQGWFGPHEAQASIEDLFATTATEPDLKFLRWQGWEF